MLEVTQGQSSTDTRSETATWILRSWHWPFTFCLLLKMQRLQEFCKLGRVHAERGRAHAHPTRLTAGQSVVLPDAMRASLLCEAFMSMPTCSALFCLSLFFCSLTVARILWVEVCDLSLRGFEFSKVRNFIRGMTL